MKERRDYSGSGDIRLNGFIPSLESACESVMENPGAVAILNMRIRNGEAVTAVKVLIAAEESPAYKGIVEALDDTVPDEAFIGKYALRRP